MLNQKNDAWSNFLKNTFKIVDNKPKADEINKIKEWIKNNVKSDFDSENLREMEKVYLLYDHLNAKLPLETIYNEQLNSTVLHQAVIAGFDVFIKKQPPEQVNWDITDNKKNTALHLAAYWGHTEIINYLLLQKANPNIPNADKKLPIYYALTSDKTNKAEIRNSIINLLNNTDPGAMENQDKNVTIPMLHQIININTNENAMDYLTAALQRAPNLIDSKDKFGRNIIHLAIILNKSEILDMLRNETKLGLELTKNGSNILHLKKNATPETQARVDVLYINITTQYPNINFFNACDLDAKTPMDPPVISL